MSETSRIAAMENKTCESSDDVSPVLSMSRHSSMSSSGLTTAVNTPLSSPNLTSASNATSANQDQGNPLQGLSSLPALHKLFPDVLGPPCLCQAEPKIPRPRNAFILYRQYHSAEISRRSPQLSNPEISKIIGSNWRNETPEGRKTWKDYAEEEQIRHRQRYPDYRYQPRKSTKNMPLQEACDWVMPMEHQICPKCQGRRPIRPTSPVTVPDRVGQPRQAKNVFPHPSGRHNSITLPMPKSLLSTISSTNYLPMSDPARNSSICSVSSTLPSSSSQKSLTRPAIDDDSLHVQKRRRTEAQYTPSATLHQQTGVTYSLPGSYSTHRPQQVRRTTLPSEYNYDNPPPASSSRGGGGDVPYPLSERTDSFVSVQDHDHPSLFRAFSNPYFQKPTPNGFHDKTLSANTRVGAEMTSYIHTGPGRSAQTLQIDTLSTSVDKGFFNDRVGSGNLDVGGERENIAIPTSGVSPCDVSFLAWRKD